MYRYRKCHEPKTLLAMTSIISKTRRLGFTLIELMVTVAVAAVLMMVAAPSFVGYQRNSELSSITNTLLSAINAARGEAMKRNSYAMVVPKDGSSWSSGWIVFIDKDLSMDYDSSKDEIVLEQSAPPSYVTISGTGNANASPPYVLYNGSGFAAQIGVGTEAKVGFGNLTFSIVRNDVPAAQAAEQTRRIIVANSGRTRSCKPSQDPLTCKANATE